MGFTLLGILNSQAAGGAGATSFDLIGTTILSGSAKNIILSGWGSEYKHIQIRGTVRKDGTTGDVVRVYINGVTALDYTTHTLRGYGSGNSVTYNDGTMRLNGLGVRNYTGSNDGSYGAMVSDILDVTNTSKVPVVRTLFGAADPNHGYSTNLATGIYYGSSGAVTSVTMNMWDNNFAAGTRFSVYGIRGE
jgi:hypothetical protein